MSSFLVGFEAGQANAQARLAAALIERDAFKALLIRDREGWFPDRTLHLWMFDPSPGMPELEPMQSEPMSAGEVAALATLDQEAREE